MEAVAYFLFSSRVKPPIYSSTSSFTFAVAKKHSSNIMDSQNLKSLAKLNIMN
jgi:hypothetical protein